MLQPSLPATALALMLATAAFSTGAAAEDTDCSETGGSAAQVRAASGSSVCAIAEGDLDKDGVADVAAIVADIRKGTAVEALSEKPATLVVYFRDKAGKLRLATKNEKGFCLGCGGAKGDFVPFTLEIGRGALIITYAGGSRWMSSTTTKWRYQGGDFHLIGLTDRVTDTVASTAGEEFSRQIDVNVSTQKAVEAIDIVTETVPDGEVRTRKKTTKCTAPAALKQATLARYEIGGLDVPWCTKRPDK
jgi:hypothetical protein